MRVAIVINTSWNIYNFRMGLVRRLIQEGHEVHTIAPIDSYTHFLTEAECIHHGIAIQNGNANMLGSS